jgi:uncharacterized protein (TIGR03435 family)
MRVVLLPALLLATSVQVPAQPAFDVISVRPNPVTNGFMTFRQISSVHLSGNRFTQRQTTLQYLIMQAYSIWDYQISGVPDWGKSPSGQYYDVEATVGGDKAPTPEQSQLMLQNLLEQRFQLTQVRHERGQR